MKKNIDLNEDKSIKTEMEVEVVGEYLKFLSFCERMKGLLPHRHPLKGSIRDKSVSYVDLFQPGRPPPSRRDDKMKFESSRRSAKQNQI